MSSLPALARNLSVMLAIYGGKPALRISRKHDDSLHRKTTHDSVVLLSLAVTLRHNERAVRLCDETDDRELVFPCALPQSPFSRGRWVARSRNVSRPRWAVSNRAIRLCGPYRSTTA